MMYTYLSTIAVQYAIYVTPLNNMSKWMHTSSQKLPTFPFQVHDIETKAKFSATYTIMSLALATKLKQSMMYGEDYAAISLTFHPNATDKYDMLYNLISYTHPYPMWNKAIRLAKPTFNGNIHQFTTSYCSWLLFQ